MRGRVLALDDNTIAMSIRRKSLLTTEDVRLLSEAIRDGIAAASKREPRRLRDLLLPAVGFVATVGVFASSWIALHSWHPAVEASYDGNVTGTLSALTLGATRGGVTWSLQGIYAQTVVLSAASEEGSLVLPVMRTKKECSLLAGRLALTCEDDAKNRPGFELVAPASISLRWQSAQLVYPLSSVPEQLLYLEVAHSSASGGAVSTKATSSSPGAATSAAIDFTGPSPITWCTSAPGVALTLTNGSLSYSVPIEPWSHQIPCSGEGSGLPVVFERVALAGPPQSPQISFGGLLSLHLHAASGSVDTRSISGALQLGDDGSDTIVPPAEVTLAAGASQQVRVTLDVRDNTTELSIGSQQLAAASTGGKELVASLWEREDDITVPVFVAALTTLIGVLIPIALRRKS